METSRNIATVKILMHYAIKGFFVPTLFRNILSFDVLDGSTQREPSEEVRFIILTHNQNHYFRGNLIF